MPLKREIYASETHVERAQRWSEGMRRQRRTNEWLAQKVGIGVQDVKDALAIDDRGLRPGWAPPDDVVEDIERALGFWDEPEPDKGGGIGRLWAAVAELDPASRREVVDEFIGQFNLHHPKRNRRGGLY